MSALEVIRRVESLGGRLFLDDEGRLKVTAAQPLPGHLLADLSAQKPAIMVALGAPLDTVISGILAEIRPYLPESLRRLPDQKLLVLANWSIIAAWDKAIQKLQET